MLNHRLKWCMMIARILVFVVVALSSKPQLCYNTLIILFCIKAASLSKAVACVYFVPSFHSNIIWINLDGVKSEFLHHVICMHNIGFSLHRDYISSRKHVNIFNEAQKILMFLIKNFFSCKYENREHIK